MDQKIDLARTYEAMLKNKKAEVIENKQKYDNMKRTLILVMYGTVNDIQAGKTSEWKIKLNPNHKEEQLERLREEAALHETDTYYIHVHQIDGYARLNIIKKEHQFQVARFVLLVLLVIILWTIAQWRENVDAIRNTLIILASQIINQEK